MWVLNGDTSRIYGNEEGWVDELGTSHPGNEPKDDFLGFLKVVLTAEPNDPGFRTIGNSVEMVDGVPTQVWQTEALPSKTPEELLAEQNAPVLAEISRLEGSITDRMWREDSMHRTAVNPVTGKTSTDYIAWVDAECAALRAQLVR